VKSEEVIARLEALVGHEAVAEDYVRLRVDVLRAQARALDALRQSDQPSVRLEELICVPALHTLYQDLVRRVGQEGSVGRAERVPPIDRMDPQELLRRALVAKEEADFASLAEPLQESPARLALVGRLLAAPAATYAVAQRNWPPAEADSPGPCPACGATPGLATLTALPGGLSQFSPERKRDCPLPVTEAAIFPGRRRLHCSLCGGVWLAPRLGCPFCGSDQPEALVQLHVDGVAARWLEGCTQCRRYLKTIDARQLPPGETPIALVEDVAGLWLDLVAEREGFRAGLPYAAMV